MRRVVKRLRVVGRTIFTIEGEFEISATSFAATACVLMGALLCEYSIQADDNSTMHLL